MEATQTIKTHEQVAAGGPLPTAPKKKRRWYGWLWRVAALCLVIPIVQVATLRFINPPVTAMMVFRMFDHLFAGESVLWSHTNMSRAEISPYLYSAVVAGEDQRFFMHHGFDMVEI